MTDIDQRFRSLDVFDPPDLRSDIVHRAKSPAPPQPGLRPGSRVVAAMVAFLVFAVAVGLGARAVRDAPADEATQPPAPDVWSALPDGLSELPAPPSSRAAAAVAWTGDALIVWGGNRYYGDPPHYDDGLIFDASARRWRDLPPSPLAARSWPGAVWTGSEVLIWGGAMGFDPGDQPVASGAAYDPATATWRTLPEAPVEPNRLVGVTWTGAEMVVVGERASAIYAPATDSWRPVTQPPMSFDTADVIWTGKEVVVYGEPVGEAGRQLPGVADGVILDPITGDWHGLPPVELPAWRGFLGSLGIDANSRTMIWNGSRLIVMDYGLRVAAFDPVSRTWTSLPPLPFNSCEGYVAAAAANGSTFVQFCGELAILDPGAARWHVVQGRGEGLAGRSILTPIAARGAFLLLGSRFDTDARQLIFPELMVYRSEGQGATLLRQAWDVAAAFGGLRAGFPYDADTVAPEVLTNLSALLTPASAAAFEDRGSNGLNRLWAYYYGFEVVRVEGTEAPFTALVRYEGGDGPFTERLMIGPGVGIDGVQHDLVILNVEAA